MTNPSKKTPRKPYVEFTPERRALYVEHVREFGTLWSAARLAGVTEETAQTHRRQDKEFAAQVEAAKQENTDQLVQEAQRRALSGTKKPIVGGPFKDQIVAHEMVYSDALMALILRSRRLEYGAAGVEALGGGINGSGGGILIVPYAPHSIVEWVELYGEAAKGLTGSAT